MAYAGAAGGWWLKSAKLGVGLVACAGAAGGCWLKSAKLGCGAALKWAKSKDGAVLGWPKGADAVPGLLNACGSAAAGLPKSAKPMRLLSGTAAAGALVARDSATGGAAGADVKPSRSSMAGADVAGCAAPGPLSRESRSPCVLELAAGAPLAADALLLPL